MRRRLAFIARVVLLLLLGTQTVLAALPCVSANAAPADAFAPTPEGCDKAPQPNLCLQHCVASDQTNGHVQVPVLTAPAIVLLVLPAPIDAPASLAFTGEVTLAHALGPPIPIRLQTLLL